MLPYRVFGKIAYRCKHSFHIILNKTWSLFCTFISFYVWKEEFSVYVDWIMKRSLANERVASGSDPPTPRNTQLQANAWHQHWLWPLKMNAVNPVTNTQSIRWQPQGRPQPAAVNGPTWIWVLIRQLCWFSSRKSPPSSDQGRSRKSHQRMLSSPRTSVYDVPVHLSVCDVCAISVRHQSVIHSFQRTEHEKRFS